MQLRYVIYSEAAGIWLGSHDGRSVWSKRPGGVKAVPNAAPTFLPEESEPALDACDNIGLNDGEDYRLVEVTPDLPGDYASVAACVKRLLPAWPSPADDKGCPRCGRDGGCKGAADGA